MTVLFVSDLHLDASRPAITALFLDFLACEARQAEALYILGDLFEAWVGDDVAQQAGFEADCAQVLRATAQGWGYAVVGKVVGGQDVVDRIKGVPTGNRGGHGDVPKQDVLVEKAVVV